MHGLSRWLSSVGNSSEWSAMTQGLRRTSSELRAGNPRVSDVDQAAATKYGLAAWSTQYAI
jgi:hypothetical protein